MQENAVRIDHELYEALVAKAGGAEYVTAWASHVLGTALRDPEAVLPSPEPISLDAACRVVLQHIDRDQAELILDLCQDTGHVPADYLLSYCQLIRDRQETAMLFDQERWVDEAVAKPVLGRETQASCEFCGAMFVVTRRGQRFCPDPDDGTEPCGRRAFLRDLHARRPAHRTRAATATTQPDLSPPQQDVVLMQRVLQQQREIMREPIEP